jgi:hypothetical protein
MAEATEKIESVKTSSDGMVKITIEKYNEMLEEISEKNGSIEDLRRRLTRAVNEPPIINRTNVIKTAEMVAEENRMWGNTFMGVGGAMFIVGALRRRKG